MRKKIIIFLLSLIVVLAFVLRIYKVTGVPPSLNWDEVAIGYNAYSLMKTGKDEWNQSFPLHFKSYGEYKLPAQIYASIPGIAIFGLNDFGVRITPVIYGTLTVLLFYFLIVEIFENEIIGLIGAFFLATSPWHIQLTRASFESSFSVLWIILGIWFLAKGFKDKKWLVLSMIPFAVSVYTYNSTRVFTPIFMVTVLIIYRKDLLKFKKQIICAILLFAVLMIPLIPFLLNHANSRYKLVSITDDAGLLPRINETRGNSTLPGLLPKLIFNKETYISAYFIENYLAHFTPDFLFINGASHKQHNVQGMGELYIFQAPFLLFGLYLLFKSKNKFRWMLLAWWLLIFVPVSITNDSIPNALRTVVADPFYQLVIAFGVYESYVYLKNKNQNLLRGVFALVIILGVLNFGYYLNQYYNIYPYSYSRDWQYGYKQALDYVKTHENEYDKIVIDDNYGQPYMFTLFYLNYDPAKFQSDPNLVREDTPTFNRVVQFGKFYFPDLNHNGSQYSDILKMFPNQKILVVGQQGEMPANLQRLDVIDFLNGSRAFEIVGIKN